MELLSKGLSQKEVQERVVKFFRAYDASRDLAILLLKEKLENKRKMNKKLRII
jgi:hypothetical protein